MIFQSTRFSRQFLWFTALVSKRGSLPAIYGALDAVKAVDVRTIPMAQGQKQSRMVAWTFLAANEQSDWHRRRSL
jgi:23S rRNA (adenine1618-N6)-methyltransferase